MILVVVVFAYGLFVMMFVYGWLIGKVLKEGSEHVFENEVQG